MFLPQIICLLVVLQIVTEDICILHLLAFMDEAVNSCTCRGLEITLNLLNLRIPLVQGSMLGKCGQHRTRRTNLDIKLLVRTSYDVEHIIIRVLQLGACKKMRTMNTKCSCSYLRQIGKVCCKEESSNQIHVKLYVENTVGIRNDSGIEKIVTIKEIYKKETIIAKADVSEIQLQHARAEDLACLMQMFSECNKDAIANLHFETARESNAWRRKIIFNVLHFIEIEDVLENSWTFATLVIDEYGYDYGFRLEEFDDMFEHSSKENFSKSVLEKIERTFLGIFSTCKLNSVYKCTDYMDHMRLVPNFSNPILYREQFIFREEEYMWNQCESDVFVLQVKYTIFQDEETLLSLILDQLQQRLNFLSKSDYTVCLRKKNDGTVSNWSICQIYIHKIILFWRYILERVMMGNDNWQSTFRCALMDSKNRYNRFDLLLDFSCDMSPKTFTDFSQLDTIIKYTSFIFILLLTFVKLCIDKFGDVTVQSHKYMVNLDTGKFIFLKILGDLFSYCNKRNSDTVLQEKGIEFCGDMLKMRTMRRIDRDVHLNTDPSFRLSFYEDNSSLCQNEYFERHRDPWNLQKATEHEYKLKSIPWYLRLRPSYIQPFATVLPLSLQEYVIEKVNTSEEHRAQLMKYEWERYKSFQNFPSSSPVQPVRLAQAGFYYTNVADEVMCFSCGIKCREWQFGDLPKERHAQMSPSCSFVSGLSDNIPIAGEERTQVQGNTPLRSSDAHTQVEDEVDLSYLESIPNSSPDYSASAMSDGWDEFVGGSDLQSGLAFESSPGNFVLHLKNEDNEVIQECRDEHGLLCGFGHNTMTPKYPLYRVLRHRVESFTGWPIYAEQEPKILAEAGLFYTGSSDCARCFQCGGGLRSWERKDIPWNEHARWYPDCSFVLRCKGMEFIEKVLYQQETLDVSDATQCNQVVCQNNHGASSSESTNTIKANVLHTEPVRTVLKMGFPVDIVQTAVKLLQEEQRSRSFLVTDLLEILLHENTIENDLARASSKPAPVVRNFLRNITEETSDWKEKETVSCKEEKEVLKSRKKDAVVSVDGKDSETSATPLSEKDYESLMEENSVLKDQMTCKICMDAEACIVFLPCSHMMTCPQCAPAFRKCPICRQLIRGTIRACL